MIFRTVGSITGVSFSTKFTLFSNKLDRLEADFFGDLGGDFGLGVVFDGESVGLGSFFDGEAVGLRGVFDGETFGEEDVFALGVVVVLEVVDPLSLWPVLWKVTVASLRGGSVGIGLRLVVQNEFGVLKDAGLGSGGMLGTCLALAGFGEGFFPGTEETKDAHKSAIAIRRRRLAMMEMIVWITHLSSGVALLHTSDLEAAQWNGNGLRKIDANNTVKISVVSVGIRSIG